MGTQGRGLGGKLQFKRTNITQHKLGKIPYTQTEVVFYEVGARWRELPGDDERWGLEVFRPGHEPRSADEQPDWRVMAIVYRWMTAWRARLDTDGWDDAPREYKLLALAQGAAKDRVTYQLGRAR